MTVLISINYDIFRPHASSSSSPVCSGRGSCECGNCVCDKSNTTIIYGQFVNAMTACVTAHYQALCAVDMVCVILDGLNVMQVGMVMHVTV